MSLLYRSIGISKQAFHQHTNRYLKTLEEQQQLLPLITQIRADHPALSARQMYFMLQPQTMGRDRFEQFCFEQGFKIARKRSWRRTTDSRGVTRFDNLLTGFELTGINQVYVSDITYYQIGDRFYYLTFIMDLYSRYITGYSASKYLLTEHTTMPALGMAIANRTIPPGLILHSDGGGQYYCKEFVALTGQHHIKNSMCEVVYENSNAERVNGTIKNSYLEYYHPNDFKQLTSMLKKAVDMYNLKRPHQSLNRLSPAVFESLLTNGTVVHKEKKNQKKKQIITTIVSLQTS